MLQPCGYGRPPRASVLRVRRVSQWGLDGAFFPSMLTDSRFVDQEFPILVEREVLEQRPEKRPDFS